MSEKVSKGQNVEAPVCQDKELGLSPAAVGSCEGPPAGDGIKQMGVWGSLPWHQFGTHGREKRILARRLCQRPSKVGEGPGRWQRERDGKRTQEL